MAVPAAQAATRILVVDGNRDAADSLVLLLECWGYRARAAYSGDEALASARSFQPAIVLTELVLPKLNGLDLALRLGDQGHRTHRKCPVLIAVTGLGQTSYRMRALAAGFEQLLVKPADPDELQRILSRIAPGKAPGPDASEDQVSFWSLVFEPFDDWRDSNRLTECLSLVHAGAR
jgi:CheY-like chemotaxis protein